MSKNKKGRKSKGQFKALKQTQSPTQPSSQATVQPTQQSASAGEVHWRSYGLDQIAQELVLDALAADKDCLNQSYKMRMATAYGLERFWGEHLRLRNSKKDADQAKSDYWKAAWDELVEVMSKAGVTIPNYAVSTGDPATIKKMSEALWQLDPDVQRVSLSVLNQLCDCIVWWTQRYKGVK